MAIIRLSCILTEERLGVVMLAIQFVLAQRAHVAAGAEGAIAGTLDHHAVYMRIVAPFRQRARAGPDHGQIERVQRLRTVQHDAPHAPVTPGDHGLFVLHAPLPDGGSI